MKKHLIAAAVAAAVAAPAMAQNVEVFGVLDVSVSSLTGIPTATGDATLTGSAARPGAARIPGGTSPGNWAPAAFQAGTATGPVTALSDGQISSSRWGIRGTEDLGGGMKALFHLEGDVNLSNGMTHDAGLFRRGAYAGLSDPRMGELTFGLRINPVIATNGALMPVSGNAVSTITSGALGFADFFTRNAITYTSPNLSGLVVQGQLGLSNDSTDATQGAVKAASGAYQLGGLSLRAAWQQRNGADGNNAGAGANPATATASSEKRTSLVGASYKVSSDLTLAAATFSNRISAYRGATIWDFSGTQFGVGYQLNPALLLGLNYTSAEGSKMTNMQARYALSKRTTAYVQYNSVDNGTNLAFSPIATNSNSTGTSSGAAAVSNQIDGCFAGNCGVLGAKQTSVGLGVIHAF